MPGGKSVTRGVGQGFNIPGPAFPKEVGGGSAEENLAAIAKDIHAIAGQFVLDPLFEKKVINLQAGQTMRIDSLTRKVGSIIVSVTTGKLDVWIGDNLGVITGTIPDWQFTVTGAPVQLVLAPDRRIFTLQANGATTQGTFTLSSV